MRLARPPEIKWQFKQPKGGDDVFPRCPSSGCFLGPSGTGKSTTLIAMLLGPYRGVFEQIHIFSPSVHIDSAWNPVKEFAQHLEGSTFHSEWDEQALKDILEQQKERIRQLKEAKTRKPLPQCFICLDDWADQPHILHSASNIVATLFVRARHFATSVWVSSQKLTAIAPVARVNFRFMCVWRLRNAKEIQALMEELSAIHPVSVLQEMYTVAIEDEEHSFIFIDLVAKRREDIFHIRFDQKLVLE
jgi:hypothetical protein